jgi:hypothetical protein
MRALRTPLFLAALCVCLPATSAFQDQPVKGKGKDKDQPKETAVDPSAMDERILRDAKLPVDGPALLQYLRDRTFSDPDAKMIATLVQQLGDKKFAVREKAFNELLQMGNSLLVQKALKDAAGNPDQETRDRVTELRKRIEERADPAVQAATARLIGARKPEGAAEVLLAYLPFAADTFVVDDICTALEKVAVRGGKAEKAALEALKDKEPLKRGAAGAGLVLGGDKEHLDAVRGLLKDPDAGVRLRVGLAFVQQRDKTAVQTLINCLKELDADKVWRAEELLHRIAGEDAPQVALGGDAAARVRCYTAWNDWWKAHEAKTDLAKIDFGPVTLGYTLVVYQHRPMAGKPFKAGTTVCEFDAAKNLRWKFELTTFAVDAQVVGPDRVLVAERNPPKVTERDFKGELKWELKWEAGKPAPNNIVGVQRLPNGHTFVVTLNAVFEYDRDGKEVFGYTRQQFDLYRGRKLRNGDVLVITNQGQALRIDAKTKKELKGFNVGFIGIQYGNVEELPNGNLLVALYQQSRVAEFDPNGKEVWSAAIANPVTAQRLGNGNTLVACWSTGRVVELDRAGREVWTHNIEGTLYLAKRR